MPELSLPPAAPRWAGLARITAAAIAGWLLALTGAALLAGRAQGADAAAAFGLGRTALTVTAPPVPPPGGLAELAPAGPSAAPWLARVRRAGCGAATGTLVRWQGRTYLITAAHVVHYLPVLAWLTPAMQPSPLFLARQDGSGLPLPPGRISYQWDLAIYPVPDDTAALELARAAPAVGEPVQFSGYPGGQPAPWAGTGQVAAVTVHPDGGAGAIVATVAAHVGQSGGALTNRAGQLLGIGVARTPAGVLAAGSSAVAAALAAAERLPTTDPPQAARLLAWLGTAVAAAVLGLAVDRLLRGSARLLRMLPGSRKGRLTARP